MVCKRSIAELPMLTFTGAHRPQITSHFPMRSLNAVRQMHAKMSKPVQASGLESPASTSCRSWTPEEVSCVVQMREQLCMSDREIAAHFPGRSTRAIYDRYVKYARDHTTSRDLRRKAYTSAEDATIVDMKAQGASMDEIAGALPGRTTGSVEHRCYMSVLREQLTFPHQRSPRVPRSHADDNKTGVIYSKDGLPVSAAALDDAPTTGEPLHGAGGGKQ